jgi:DNA-binding LacI/PurR family transcriptional regulator
MLRQQNISSKTKVELYLREKLRQCRPGDKLPSIRQLKSQLEVSQSVVDKAVMQLVLEGLVDVRRPTGLFKAEPARPVIKLLSFHEAPSVRSFYHEFLANLLYEMAKNGRRVELISDLKAIRKTLETPANNTILTFGASWQDYSLVSRDEHLKTINLLPNFVENVSPALVIDDTQVIETQIKYLVEAGHRKISYLHMKRDDIYIRAQNTRWDTFHRLGFENGLEFDKRFLIGSSDRDPERIAGEVASLLNTENPPTAFLLASDILVPGVYEGIKRAGLVPGKDIAVLGTDNRPWCEFTSPRLSSVGFDYEQAFEQLISMIAKIEKGAEGTVIKLPVKIFERESTTSI